MGREATCRARWGGRSGEGRALLEADELVFRGAFRVKVPLAAITRVAAKAGALALSWPGGTLTLALGASADAWADAIANPRSLVDKLGVKPGLAVVLVGRFDAEFRARVAKASGTKPGARPAAGS